MASPIPPVIILVRPQLPENGGAAARAMGNFGLKALRFVAPLFPPLDPKAVAMAAGAETILKNAAIFPTLDEAVADLSYVYGTCATERHMVKRYAPLREAMAEIADYQKAGLIFGPERTGLNNDEMVKCRTILQIPTDPSFSSLNLAQSVAITAYEWLQATKPSQGKLQRGESIPASNQQVHGFLAALENILDAKNFWRIRHKKTIMWRNLQNIFTRMDLTEQEIRTLQGMVKCLSGASSQNQPNEK